MLMKFIINSITSILNIIIGLLNNLLSMLKIDIFLNELNWLIELIQPLNAMLPIKELLWVLSILCMFAFGAFIFWIIQEIIKLIRG